MARRFEELDGRATPMGDLSLRRRTDPALQVEVYEVKLGDEFLMSSLFTVAEVELARLALAQVTGDALDVVVGGLGLGWTARTVLEDPRVRALHVVEALDAVVDWHERALLPHAGELTGDPRTRLVHGDFFALVADGGLGGPWHAVVVDIDHTPEHLLHPSHAGFYTADGLRRVADLLHPGGVFALWSDAAPDEAFTARLRGVFAEAAAHVVAFDNPVTGGRSANTVYTAVIATAPGPTVSPTPGA